MGAYSPIPEGVHMNESPKPQTLTVHGIGYLIAKPTERRKIVRHLARMSQSLSTRIREPCHTFDYRRPASAVEIYLGLHPKLCPLSAPLHQVHFPIDGCVAPLEGRRNESFLLYE